MKNYDRLAVLLLLFIFLPLSTMAEPPCASDGPEGLNRTGSGLVLRKSGVDHIQSVLGPTLVFRTDLTSDTSHMCYSAARDNSLIAFEIEDRFIVRIRVMADKHHYERWDWCTRMPLSANDLALANGLRLGLDRTGALDLLGVPMREEGDRWHYGYRLKALNGREQIRPRNDRKDRCLRLEMEFMDSRLIRFDLRVGLSGSRPAAVSP